MALKPDRLYPGLTITVPTDECQDVDDKSDFGVTKPKNKKLERGKNLSTVKTVLKGHPREGQKVAA